MQGHRHVDWWPFVVMIAVIMCIVTLVAVLEPGSEAPDHPRGLDVKVGPRGSVIAERRVGGWRIRTIQYGHHLYVMADPPGARSPTFMHHPDCEMEDESDRGRDD